MTAKILVLYPQPLDPVEFERVYFSSHMPLMRELVAPHGRTPTFRVISGSAPFYRVAEVQFASLMQLQAFTTLPKNRRGRVSSEAVSTGGKPIYLVCEAD